MPILETFATDHGTLETMRAKLGDTASNRPKTRVEQFSHVQTLLQAHARAEEEVVYRRLAHRTPDELKTLEAFLGTLRRERYAGPAFSQL